jgi:hypothetical protein
MNIFWELAISDLNALMKSLNEEFVPKAVLKPSLQIDSIQKCLRILCKSSSFRPPKKEQKAFSVFRAIIESACRN